MSALAAERAFQWGIGTSATSVRIRPIRKAGSTLVADARFDQRGAEDFREGIDNIISQSNALLRQMLFARQPKENNISTHIYNRICESLTHSEDDYSITEKTALSALSLASDLIKISDDIVCYPSPEDTITFDLVLDDMRATIIHGRRNTLVISRGNDMEWGDFDNTPDEFQKLVEKISNFRKA